MVLEGAVMRDSGIAVNGVGGEPKERKGGPQKASTPCVSRRSNHPVGQGLDWPLALATLGALAKGVLLEQQDESLTAVSSTRGEKQ